MNIKQSTSELPERFEAIDQDKLAGFMTYHWEQPRLMIIDHTEVGRSMEARGLVKN